MIKYISNGNILESKCDAIVNTINCFGVMGKGLALQFRSKYPKMFQEYRSRCKRNIVKPGSMDIHNAMEKIIVNFPTKLHWKNPSKIEYIDEGLLDLSKKIQELNIKSIAIPKLGCNLGGLAWENVKPRIVKMCEALEHVEFEIYE